MIFACVFELWRLLYVMISSLERLGRIYWYKGVYNVHLPLQESCAGQRCPFVPDVRHLKSPIFLLIFLFLSHRLSL